MGSLPLAIDPGNFVTLSSVVPAALSVLSLVVAVTALRITTRQARVTLVMPRKIRLEYNPWATVFYIQPNFFVGNLTTRAAVIIDMELTVRMVDEVSPTISGNHTDQDVSRTIPWWGMVAFDWSKEYSREVFGGIVSDAVPLPVTFAAPQSPLAQFLAGPDWQRWLQRGGSYDLTISARLGTSRKRVEGTIRNVYLEEDKIDRLNQKVAEELQRAERAGEEPTEEGEFEPFFPREYVRQLSFRPESTD